MNKFCSTLICSMLMMPTVAQAELKFGGELVLGYGKVGNVSEEYGILKLTATDTYTFNSGVGLTWNVQARGRTDQSRIGFIDEDNLDASIELDLGSGGKFGVSTFSETYHDFPWADGELYNRGSVGVMPVIRKRYDGVADSQFDGNRVKVDPDVLLTYSNKFGPVKLDLIANPLGKWDGNNYSQLFGAPAVARVEGKLTLPTSRGIYSVAVNDLDDAEFQVVYPMRDIGLTLIARHSINEGKFSDYRTNLVAIYRAKNMGIFKGFMLAHARDDDADRTMLSLNFGYKDFDVKLAGDTDGDMAVEGSYAFNDKTSVRFGWDNGHGAMEGFNDASFPAPVFAPARGSAFEAALVHKF